MYPLEKENKANWHHSHYSPRHWHEFNFLIKALLIKPLSAFIPFTVNVKTCEILVNVSEGGRFNWPMLTRQKERRFYHQSEKWPDGLNKIGFAYY